MVRDNEEVPLRAADGNRTCGLAEDTQQRIPKHRLLLLHFMALSPILVVGFGLIVFQSIVGAVLTFQIVCLFGMPMAYIMTSPVEGGGLIVYQLLMRRLLRDWRIQLKFAIFGFFSVIVMGFGGYMLVRRLLDVPHVIKVAEKDGLNDRVFTNSLEVVLFALDFTFINSLLEELFWRVFLYRELGMQGARAREDCSLESLEEQSPELLVVTSRHSSSNRCEIVSPVESSKILVSAYYASYHVVVVLVFVPWYLAIAAGIGLVVLGRIFVFCRDSEVFGLVTGYGLHAGADAAFVLIMLNMYGDFLR